jgi:glycosyltransferase involved in cell wall biosynthesis
MKICFLLESTALSGGVKGVFQLAEELARRDHEVTVLSAEPPPRWFSLRLSRFERSPFSQSRALSQADAAVATFWTTAEPAVRHCRGEVFHFCQGYEADFGVYDSIRPAIEAAYRLPTTKIVSSPHSKERLRAVGMGEAIFIGQPFEAGDFLVPERDFSRRPLRVFLSGIFEGVLKGVEESLHALRGLRDRGRRFIVVRASAEPFSEAERRIGATDEYHFQLPPARIPKLLEGVDLFLGPSHWQEGFGLPELEALAAGLPSAYSDTAAHRNSAGEVGIFFPQSDLDAMAAAVDRLLADDGLRQALSAAGPPRAALFRTSDVADRFEEALRQLATPA